MLLNLLARFLARPAVTDWLIKRAAKTPYTHIYGDDGSLYMERYWLFNPYPTCREERRWWKDLLPSIRLHRILTTDADLHDHPWNARSFILRGWYVEERLEYPTCPEDFHDLRSVNYFRLKGKTFRLDYGQFHRISMVDASGVWTMFVTGKKRGSWNFLVNGVKIPWRDYAAAKTKEKEKSNGSN